MKKNKMHAIEVVGEIQSEVCQGVIRDYEMPTLCNIETGKDTGCAVIFLLSGKYDYTNNILDDWKKRLRAEDYIITVSRNQLRIRFNIIFSKKNEQTGN